MSAETPLRILSLDGGGVRGISLLCILQVLMDQIKLKLIVEFKPLEPIPPLRPY
jgi:patatin-like phospholipase/acyl hydrolase